MQTPLFVAKLNKYFRFQKKKDYTKPITEADLD